MSSADGSFVPFHMMLGLEDLGTFTPLGPQETHVEPQ